MAGTDLLLPVSRREPAIWCPRTGRSLPSPCSAASLRTSLTRSWGGSAWRPGCPHHLAPPAQPILAAQLRPGSLHHETGHSCSWWYSPLQPESSAKPCTTVPGWTGWRMGLPAVGGGEESRGSVLAG